MRIAYCEDEPAQAALVRAMILRWAESRKITAEVILYESAEEFLFKNETFLYDVVFLDIAMRQMNGVELARAIRQKDKNLPIAFLTADRTFAIEGYEVHAVRYLLKPVTAEKLGSLLDELLEAAEKDMQDTVCITVGEKGAVRKISESSICYIEVLGHYTQLHLKDSSAPHQGESGGSCGDAAPKRAVREVPQELCGESLMCREDQPRGVYALRRDAASGQPQFLSGSE